MKTKELRVTITISVFQDGSIDVNEYGNDKLNSLEWLGAISGVLLGTTTFNRPNANEPPTPPAEEGERE